MDDFIVQFDDFIVQDDDALIHNDVQNVSMIFQDDDPYAFRSLTDFQQTILAFLPIPSAILSIFGSSVIVYMAYISRKSRPWTPYNRLLVGMSVYDIIASIGLASAAFLNPMETSKKAFALGNDASCSAIGFVNQLSYSGTLYNACLSFYFLFTARFGMKNDQIARRIEPTMHVFNVGFPLITGIIGLVLGVYAEPEVGLGCWVNRYPKRCGYGPDGTGEPCHSTIISWIFGGWIAIVTLIALIVNNLVIWIFVRRRIRKAVNTRCPTSRSSTGGTMDVDEDQSTGQVSLLASMRSGPIERSSQTSITMNQDTIAAQERRLALVSSQAFLFVASYFVSGISTYILRLFESMAADYVWEMELPYNNYILLVLQAILLPLQGLFNMLVYIRPKYLKSKSDFPNESRNWALRRAIWGSKCEPIHSLHVEIKQDGKGNKTAHQALGKDMVSSLTNGSDGVKEVESEEHETTDRPRSSRRKVTTRGSNSLDVISEISEPENSGSLSVSSRKVPFARNRQKGDHVKDPSSVASDTNGSASILMDGSILQSPKQP